MSKASNEYEHRGGLPSRPPLKPVPLPTSSTKNSLYERSINNDAYTSKGDRANRAKALSDKCEHVDLLVHSISQQRRKNIDSFENETYTQSIEAGKALHIACWSDASLETVLEIIRKNPEVIDYEDDEGRIPIEVCESQKCCCLCCCCNKNRKRVIMALERGEEYYRKSLDPLRLPLLPRLHESHYMKSKTSSNDFDKDLLVSSLLHEREQVYRNVADKLKMIENEKHAISREIQSLETTCTKKKVEIKSIQEKLERKEKSPTKYWFKSTPHQNDCSESYQLGMLKLDLQTLERDLEEMKEAEFIIDTKRDQLLYVHFAPIDQRIKQIEARVDSKKDKLA